MLFFRIILFLFRFTFVELAVIGLVEDFAERGVAPGVFDDLDELLTALGVEAARLGERLVEVGDHFAQVVLKGDRLCGPVAVQHDVERVPLRPLNDTVDGSALRVHHQVLEAQPHRHQRRDLLLVADGLVGERELLLLQFLEALLEFNGGKRAPRPNGQTPTATTNDSRFIT